MEIELKPSIKKNVNILMGRCAEKLYTELSSLGYIDRLKEINQLGAIKIKSKYKRTRFDYVNLQLYFHDVLRECKGAVVFEYAYSNQINFKEFDLNILDKTNKPSILDVIQIMILISNVGHFKNTFDANIGIIEACNTDESLKERFLDYFSAEDRILVNKIIDNNNYMHFNLINALLLLDKCDKNLESVRIAKKLIHIYLGEDTSSEKIRYAFKIFKGVRNLAFYTYDLPVSAIPFKIDISSKEDICTIFNELFDKYNNNETAKKLFDAIGSLLGATVYNKEENVICSYENISKRIRKNLLNNGFSDLNFAEDIISEDSIYNRKYSQNHNFNADNILKLTFEEDEVNFEDLFRKIEKINFVRVGYYYRRDAKKTILISLDKRADESTALRIVRHLITAISKNNPDKEDVRYINITKFFMYVLFKNREVEIKPTKEIVLYVARGTKQKTDILNKTILNNKKDDFEHELCVIRDYLKCKDKINDTAIVVAGSIEVKKNSFDKENELKNDCGDKNDKKSKKCNVLKEFDGIIIYPYRKNGQIVFLEAKNRREKFCEGKNCLIDKFNALEIDYVSDDIQIVNRDSYFEYSLK